MVVVPTTLLSKQLDYDVIYIRCCHVSDKTIGRMSTLGIKGIPANYTRGSHMFCRLLAISKSNTASINRVSTRINDPDTCFYTLAIDIWGLVNTPSIGNVSDVFGDLEKKERNPLQRR
jgi:hypothetical protein